MNGGPDDPASELPEDMLDGFDPELAARHPLIRRAIVHELTRAKYIGRELDWRAAMTCVHVVRFHLVKMGHRPEPMPRVRSLVAAKRALAQRGWVNCADLLDGQPGLLRITPAMMLPGDLAFRGSEDGVGGILINAGPHKMMGWFEDVPGFSVMDMTFDQLEGAWRV